MLHQPNSQRNTQKVIAYFSTFESRYGYDLLLKGTKHFGYYPYGKENLSIPQAQKSMEAKLAEKLNLPKDSLVLDAGCGEGNVAMHLAQEYDFNVRGIDLLKIAIQRATEKAKKQNLENKVTFAVGDYSKLNFPDNFFDGVFAVETLVHAVDYKQALKEFYRVLKPNGKLCLLDYSICAKENLTAKQREIWDMIIEESGMHSLPYFIHGKFPQMLNESGFKEVDVENITARVMPMVKKFYMIAYVPYLFIKFFGLQRKFINATSAVEGYKSIKNSDIWRYNIVIAKKK